MSDYGYQLIAHEGKILADNIKTNVLSSSSFAAAPVGAYHVVILRSGTYIYHQKSADIGVSHWKPIFDIPGWVRTLILFNTS